MLTFLQSIFASPAQQTAAPDAALVRAATERVIAGTDPRLRAVRGYRKQLHSAVICSLEHVIELVDSLPPAVEISRDNFASDARLRAFFVSADHLQQTVSYSQNLKDYLADGATRCIDPIYCLLSLERSDKNVLGFEREGEVLKRDVAQVVVNFSGHRLGGTADSEAGTRWELKKRAFDHLIQMALQRIIAMRSRKHELEQQRALLQSKLKDMQAGRWGLQPLLEPADAPPPDYSALEQQIAGIESALQALRTDPVTLDSYLRGIAVTLSEPQKHLRLEHITLTLDAMNVRRDETSAQATTLSLDVVASEQQQRILLLGYVPRADILAPSDSLTSSLLSG